MTHPLFRKEIFVETAFARRFQKMLQDAWDNRSWHLLVADPGEGLTMSIRDLQKGAGGRSVLAVVAPKNNDDEQALGDQFLAALGLPIRMRRAQWKRWKRRKNRKRRPKQPGFTFSGVVRIDPQRFTNSGINLVECPGCGRMRSLTPVKGVLRFKAHPPRKQQTKFPAKRWSTTGKTDWDVVGE